MATKPETSRKHALSVEAYWDGALLGQWTLDGDDTLSAGPKAQCDLVVAKTILPRRRTIIALNEDTQSYTVDVPANTLFSWPHSAHRDAYRLPAWRHATTTPQRYAIAQALDLHLGPWRLRLRPTPRVPTVSHRRRATKKPIAALIASALIHALIITAALASPPPKATLTSIVPGPVSLSAILRFLYPPRRPPKQRQGIAVTSVVTPPPLPKNAPAWLRDLARLPPIYASIDFFVRPERPTFSPTSWEDCYLIFPDTLSGFDPAFIACLIEADKVNKVDVLPRVPSWLRIGFNPQVDADMSRYYVFMNPWRGSSR